MKQEEYEIMAETADALGGIVSVTTVPSHGITVVKFRDGITVQLKKAAGDAADIETAIVYAAAYHMVKRTDCFSAKGQVKAGIRLIAKHLVKDAEAEQLKKAQKAVAAKAAKPAKKA